MNITGLERIKHRSPGGQDRGAIFKCFVYAVEGVMGIAMQKNILPIMIGSTPAAARAMLRDLGGALHVIDRKLGGLFWVRGVRFHRISGVERDIIAMQIKDICNDHPELLAVIGASPEYRGLLDELAPEIESYCIILREDNLERCKALKNSGIDG